MSRDSCQLCPGITHCQPDHVVSQDIGIALTRELGVLCWPPVGFGTVPLIPSGRSGEPVSINPFDDDNGSFFVLVNHE
jgi:MbtH-like protein